MPRFYSACARAIALAVVAVAFTATATVSAFAQQARYEGHLTVMWGDPRPGVLAGGRTNFYLTLPDGTEHPLSVAPDDQNRAIQYFGKRVAVQGEMGAREASGAPATITAGQIELLEKAEPEQAEAVTIKKTLFVLLKFKNDTQEPHPPSFYTKLTNSLTPSAGMLATVNGFFNKTSWGKLKFDADITPWIRLPGEKEKYANCGWSSSCFNSSLLRADALPRVATAGFDINDYDTINFVFNNDLDCCAWGGGFSNGMKSFGTTYQPPWGQEAKVYVHELGHSLGLPHSGWVYYAYDNPWDDMGTNQVVANSASCGTYMSANNNATTTMFCNEPGAGFLASYKNEMGWLPNANKVVIDGPGTTDVILHANALPLGNKKKLIIVCYPGKPCTGSNARYLTIEAKISVAQFENGLLHDGVILHDFWRSRPATPSFPGGCFFNNQSGWAQTIDRTKNDYDTTTCQYKGGGTLATAALGNAQYGPGHKYRSPANGITVEVIKAVTDGYRVRVTVE